MTPEELASLHPRLFHVTFSANAPLIRAHGLHPAETLVLGADLTDRARQALLTSRQNDTITVRHPDYGVVTLNDNRPLVLQSLASCLDDDLTPEDWIGTLNRRVFFSTQSANLEALRKAAATRAAHKSVLVFDTLALARRYADRLEIAPFNTGNTMRRPARRGHGTFAPLLETDYRDWRLRRGNNSPDRIKEVTIRGSVLDVQTFLVPDGKAAE